MTKECWCKIKDFSNYSVSTLGRIKNNKTNRIRKCENKGSGYLYIALKNNIGRKDFLIHRLVAKAFISNLENKPVVHHINGIKYDNRVENLEWCSYKENTQAAKDAITRGEDQWNSKLIEDKVLEIRKKYKPQIYTYKMLAKEYDVCIETIRNIINRTRWSHI